jgi:hypothetical protein
VNVVLADAILHVRHSARAVGDHALVAYYTKSPFHLASLEADVERLDRDLAGLRMVLQGIRSRGEDPVS